MSLSEVAAAVNLARPTARRLLLTLEELGYVRLHGSQFSRSPPGGAWASLSARRAVGHARPHMERARSEHRRVLLMAQLDGSDIVYVAGFSVPKIIGLRVGSATRLPHCRLAGQGAPAALDPTSSRHAGPAQPVLSSRVHAAHQGGGREGALLIRARGWALADKELAPGVRSVAIPVRDGTGPYARR